MAVACTTGLTFLGGKNSVIFDSFDVFTCSVSLALMLFVTINDLASLHLFGP